MADINETQLELNLLGMALRKLRMDAGLTQKEAGENAKPAPFTSQAWGNLEQGKVKGLLDPAVQTKLLAAIGATKEALQFERNRIEQYGPPSLPGRTQAQGVGERPAPPFMATPGHRQAIFPLGGDQVVISFPKDLTPADLRKLRIYLDTLFDPPEQNN